jgi:hypothetical protein
MEFPVGRFRHAVSRNFGRAPETAVVMWLIADDSLLVFAEWEPVTWSRFERMCPHSWFALKWCASQAYLVAAVLDCSTSVVLGLLIRERMSAKESQDRRLTLGWDFAMFGWLKVFDTMSLWKRQSPSCRQGSIRPMLLHPVSSLLSPFHELLRAQLGYWQDLEVEVRLVWKLAMGMNSEADLVWGFS